MRFGIQLPTFGPTAGRDLLGQCARLCEQLGYDSIWANDHVLVPKRLDPPYGYIFECLTTLSFVAAVTERVRIGTSVLIVPQREPVLAAKQVATLDVLSGGRVICGVGTGYVDDEFRFLGADTRHRGARLDACLGVMRGLWSGDASGLPTEWASLTEGRFGPLPPQGSRLPIWIAGNSDRAIERAARVGDAWHPAGVSPDELAAGVRKLGLIVGDRPVEIALKVRAGLAEVTGRPDDQRSPTEVNHAYELYGRVPEVIAALRAFEMLGVGYVVMFMFHRTADELRQSLETFAELVMPHFTV